MLFKTTTATMSLLLCLVTASLNQDDASSTPGCRVIDEKRSPQFIVFEGQSASGINLRLRNNTSCAIIVETDDTYPTRLKKLPQGGATIETVFDSRDGQRLQLHYLIQKTGNEAKRAYGWGDSVFTYEIAGGQSIMFEVPTNHLKQRGDIAVPFAYAWEGKSSIPMGVGGVAHRVYFLFEDLPRAALP